MHQTPTALAFDAQKLRPIVSAILGEYDFLAIIKAPDRDTAFQAALTIQGYGLTMQTMEVAETEHFAELVSDH